MKRTSKEKVATCSRTSEIGLPQIWVLYNLMDVYQGTNWGWHLFLMLKHLSHHCTFWIIWSPVKKKLRLHVSSIGSLFRFMDKTCFLFSPKLLVTLRFVLTFCFMDIDYGMGGETKQTYEYKVNRTGQRKINPHTYTLVHYDHIYSSLSKKTMLRDLPQDM